MKNKVLKRSIILIMALCSLYFVTYAQPNYFQKKYINGDDICTNLNDMIAYQGNLQSHFVLPDPTGFIPISYTTGAIMVGGIWGDERTGFIIKTDERGDVLWNHNSFDTYFKKVVELHNGHIAVAGYSYDTNDQIFMVLNGSGTAQWSVDFDDMSHVTMAKSPWGNIVVAAKVGYGQNRKLFFAELAATNGNILKSRYYQLPEENNNFAPSDMVEHNGEYYLTGFHIEENFSWLAKLDGSLTLDYLYKYDTSLSISFENIGLSEDAIFVSGTQRTVDGDGFKNQLSITKINKNTGVPLFHRLYNTQYRLSDHSMVILNNEINVSLAHGGNMNVLKIDLNGNILTQKDYGYSYLHNSIDNFLEPGFYTGFYIGTTHYNKFSLIKVPADMDHCDASNITINSELSGLIKEEVEFEQVQQTAETFPRLLLPAEDLYSQWICPLIPDIGEDFHITVSPNPAIRNFNVDLPFELDIDAVVKVFDYTGPLVLETIIPSGETAVHITDMEPGMYIVVVTAGSQSDSGTVIVED